MTALVSAQHHFSVLQPVQAPLRPSALVSSYGYGPRRSAWAAAVHIYNSELTKDSRKQLVIDGYGGVTAGALKCHPTATLAQLIEVTENARAEFHNSKSSAGKKIDSLLSGINRYAAVVDVLIQQHPDTTAIAWGAIRMLVTAAVAEKQTAEKLSAVLADIMNDIGRFEEYQVIYPSVHRLDESIARLYAEIINFLVRSRIFYEMNPISRAGKAVISPFDTKFKGILEKMNKLRESVEKEVALVSVKQQSMDSEAGAQFREATYIHTELQECRWFLEDQHRKELATKRQEKLLRNIRTWLVTADFDHLRREKQCLEGTCEWIFEKKQYMEWLDKPNGVLWVYGIPGCGKSVMACFLLSGLSQSNPVIHFFCRNDEERKRKPAYIVCTLILQLMDHPLLFKFQHQISTMVAKVYNSFPDIANISIDRLCALLARILAILPPTTIIIDALDECEQEGSSRGFLQDQLLSFARDCSYIKLILISRHEEPFIEAFTSKCHTIEMGQMDVDDDIRAVVTKSVLSNAKLRKLGDRIIDMLLAGADGMFLWAELMLHTLKCARNMKAVERMLEDLPVGLDGVYSQILTNIGKSLTDEELVLRRELFGWITTAVRPLTLDELCTALAIESAKDYLDDGNLSLDLVTDIRKVCGPLVQISKDSVQVVHISVKEMLWKKDTALNGTTSALTGSQLRYAVQFDSEIEHARAAMACLSYLSFSEFSKTEHIGVLVEGDGSGLHLGKENLFLEYATMNWMHHLARSEGQGIALIGLLTSFLGSLNCFTWMEFYSAFLTMEGECLAHHYQLRSNLLRWLSNIEFSGNSETKEKIELFLINAISAGLKAAKKLYGDEDLRTLKIAQRLGVLYDHDDRLEDAIVAQENIIRDASHHKDPKIQYVVRKSCIELSSYVALKSDFPRAIELLEQVLGGSDSADWIHDRLGAEAMADLAVIYRQQDSLKMAQDLMERGVEGLTHFRGLQHILTIRYTVELCRIYMLRNEVEKANKLLQSVLKVSDDFLGVEHPRSLHARHLLANILQQEGKLDEAKDTLNEVLRLFIKVWGLKSRSVAKARMDLAALLVERKEISEAAVQYKAALALHDEIFGPDHASTTDAAAKLLWCRGEVGFVEEEEVAIEQIELPEVISQWRLIYLLYGLVSASIATIVFKLHLSVVPWTVLLGFAFGWIHLNIQGTTTLGRLNFSRVVTPKAASL